MSELNRTCSFTGDREETDQALERSWPRAATELIMPNCKSKSSGPNSYQRLSFAPRPFHYEKIAAAVHDASHRAFPINVFLKKTAASGNLVARLMSLHLLARERSHGITPDVPFARRFIPSLEASLPSWDCGPELLQGLQYHYFALTSTTAAGERHGAGRAISSDRRTGSPPH